MEQRKPRNKKGDRHRSPEKSKTPKNSGVKKLTEKDYDYTNSDKSQFSHLKRETLETSEKPHGKRQVVSNWAKYEEIRDDETFGEGKDFESLLNAPVSEGGHFVFKSEKNWAVQISAYSELYSLNIKKLATAVDCIPFIGYINVEETYFTRDQLTKIHNKAEKARGAYAEILRNEEEVKGAEKTNNIEEKSLEINEEEDVDDDQRAEEIDDKAVDEEDLDFLLSLKEPAPSTLTLTLSSDPGGAVRGESRSQSAATPTKSIDLEKWLDSLLAD